MKNELLAALRAKFPDVSEAILSRIADKLAKTVSKPEEVAPAIEGVTIQNLIESYGDSRATEASQTAVTNYEKKYNLKDGKAPGGEPQPKEPTATDDSSTPAWAKALIESNRQLTEKVGLMEGESIEKTRKQQLDGIVSKLPQALRSPYARISLKEMSDEQFTTFMADITSEVEKIGTEINAKGTVFTAPAGGGGGDKEPSEQEVKEVVSQMNF